MARSSTIRNVLKLGRAVVAVIFYVASIPFLRRWVWRKIHPSRAAVPGDKVVDATATVVDDDRL